MTGKQSKVAVVVAQCAKTKSQKRREKQKLKKAQSAPSVSRVKAGAMAPVSVGAKIKGAKGRSIREQGTDHMYQGVVNRSKVGVITQQVVMPALFPRMQQLAKSFQRIKYHRLRFEIVTGTATGNAGVYVAGFIADATDPVSDATVTSTLLASGGEATKYWQSTEVVVQKFGPELYYTNPHQGEERWSSPGSLVIASISAPTDSVTFEVFCHWDVTFSVPTYESTEKSEDKSYKVKVDVYTSTGNKYLSKRNGNDWTPLTVNDFDPPAVVGNTYVLGHWRCGSVQASTGTLDGIFGFFSIKVLSNLVYPVDEKGLSSTQNFHAEEYVLRKGELVFHETSLRRSKVPWYNCPVPQWRSCSGRSLTSMFPATSHEYWTTSDATIDSFSLEPYIDESSAPIAEASGLACSAKSPESSEKSLENLTKLLSQVISSALSANSTECPPNLSARYTTRKPPDSDVEDFDVL